MRPRRPHPLPSTSRSSRRLQDKSKKTGGRGKTDTEGCAVGGGQRRHQSRVAWWWTSCTGLGQGTGTRHCAPRRATTVLHWLGKGDPWGKNFLILSLMVAAWGSIWCHLCLPLVVADRGIEGWTPLLVPILFVDRGIEDGLPHSILPPVHVNERLMQGDATKWKSRQGERAAR
jgi:hypothetical protein